MGRWQHRLAPLDGCRWIETRVALEVLSGQLWIGSMSKGLLSSLRSHAEALGDAIAVEVKGKQLDYRTLGRRSDDVAGALRASAIAPGARVAILAKSSVEFFAFLIGAMKAGAVPVPINWRLAPSEVRNVIDDSQAELLAMGEEFFPKFGEAAEASPRLRRIILLPSGGSTTAQEHPCWNEWLDASRGQVLPKLAEEAQDIVLQIYTSGTTGSPKGVMMSRAGFDAYLGSLATAANFTESSISLSTMPLFHIGGTGWCLAGMHRGARVLLMQDVDPDLILGAIDTHSVTHLIAVPTVVQMLLQSPDLQRRDFASLSRIYYGGGPMTESILQRALDVFGCEFVQGYGMTECGLITVLAPEYHSEARPLLRSCGLPLDNTKIRLVDPETLADVPVGNVGEIWVDSPNNMAGYWGQPETTRQTLVDGIWLRTGDCARRDENGFLFLQDRLKDMIITGGENVYPAEVENVLMAHPGVIECAVIGVPSEKWVETVKAVIVTKPGVSPDAREFISFCKSRLAGYKCPTIIAFVDNLPKGPSGKVLKYRLKEMHSG